MTETHRESLPFADESIFDELRNEAGRIFYTAFEQGIINEDKLRELCSQIHAYEGDEHEYYTRLLLDFLDANDEHTLSRIRKGAEFIEGITKDDPRYEQALRKYDGLVEKHREQRKWRDKLEART